MPNPTHRASSIGRSQALQASQVVLVVAAAVAIPTALTLRTVTVPGSLTVDSDNPTPLGYTWSLSLFLVPLAVLSWWFGRRNDLRLARRAFWRTLAVLAPVGCVLDLLLGNASGRSPWRSPMAGGVIIRTR